MSLENNSRYFKILILPENSHQVNVHHVKYARYDNLNPELLF